MRTKLSFYKYLCLFIGVLFCTQIVPAKTPAKKKNEASNSASVLIDVTQHYKKSDNVKMHVIKNTKMEMLGKDTNFEGDIYFSKGRMRWDTQKPEKNLIVIDGKYVWTVQYPPAEFEAPPQVTKSAKNNMVLFSLFTGTKPVTDFFKVTKTEKKDSQSVFELESLTKDVVAKNLKITLDTKNKTINEISYSDDVGNQIKMSFDKIEFDSKLDSKLFQYQPPKDAQVTNI